MSGTDRRMEGMHSKRTNEGTGAFQGEGIGKTCFKKSASAKAQIRLLANTNLRVWCKTIVTCYIKQGGYNSFAPSPWNSYKLLLDSAWDFLKEDDNAARATKSQYLEVWALHEVGVEHVIQFRLRLITQASEKVLKAALHALCAPYSYTQVTQEYTYTVSITHEYTQLAESANTYMYR